MQLFDFAIVDRLHLPPKLPNFLFFIIGGKNFLKAFERDHFRRQFVATQIRLEIRRRPADQAEPNVARKHCARIGQLVLLIEIAKHLDGRALLMLQAVSQLRAHGRPFFRTHVRFVTGGEQRTHRREHCFAAVYGHARFGNFFPFHRRQWRVFLRKCRQGQRKTHA